MSFRRQVVLYLLAGAAAGLAAAVLLLAIAVMWK